MKPFCRSLLAAALILPLAAAAPAEREALDAVAADWGACRRAIGATEPGSGLPPGLLGAIALVETGRAGPKGAPSPWPWSVNAGGDSHYANSKADAVAMVRALQAEGRRSIDVGCMQINLLHHPEAFASLEEAFDPAANLRYAARFLHSLHVQWGDWGTAIGRYHSGEADRGLAYGRRVALARLGRAWTNGGPVPLPSQALGDLCAPGLRPMMVLRRNAAKPRLVCQRAGRTSR
ncbi:lytic transglycosylase domain-containing protein [Pseudoroseomonas globiformis]|uniref:Lytic transglycosylase domain-containing protein n=1 Tax=Teichococcus globiformis TaxID=2307229 RepID=A0ABV7G659_9PROT